MSKNSKVTVRQILIQFSGKLIVIEVDEFQSNKMRIRPPQSQTERRAIYLQIRPILADTFTFKNEMKKIMTVKTMAIMKINIFLCFCVHCEKRCVHLVVNLDFFSTRRMSASPRENKITTSAEENNFVKRGTQTTIAKSKKFSTYYFAKELCYCIKRTISTLKTIMSTFHS